MRQQDMVQQDSKGDVNAEELLQQHSRLNTLKDPPAQRHPPTFVQEWSGVKCSLTLLLLLPLLLPVTLWFLLLLGCCSS